MSPRNRRGVQTVREGMMEEKEVREAVKYFKEIHKNDNLPTICSIHQWVLIRLAESWLARKMPEKRTTENYPNWKSGTEILEWNAAIDACRLASIKSDKEVSDYIEACIDAKTMDLEDKVRILTAKLANVVSEEEILKVFEENATISWDRGPNCLIPVLVLDKKPEIGCAKDLAKAIAEAVNGGGKND
jgi:hypothetical protein